ncbi:MAG: CapA family protein [Rhodospirillales bacterium]|nr:CapA family protein [Rhodospirillales bacterium]
MVGDLMCETFCQQACIYDNSYFFKDCFSIVKPILNDADFTIGNLETTISENHPYMGIESKLNGNYNCNSPVEFLDAVKYAGFNVLVAANNHNLDAQKQGHFDTIRHIEEYGFKYTGIFKNENQQRYLILEKNGIKIGLLSYYTEHNKITHDFTSEDIDILFNKYLAQKVKQDVDTLKQNGVDYTMAYIHWGIERVHTTTSYQQKIAKEMAEAGVDYILGSHPHALQPYDEININDRTVPVIYSLGNFLSSSRLGQCTRDTIVLQLELKKIDGKCCLVRNEYVPCQIFDWFEGRNYPIIPLNSKFNGGIKSKMLKKAAKRIKNILGNRIKIKQ